MESDRARIGQAARPRPRPRWQCRCSEGHVVSVPTGRCHEDSGGTQSAVSRNVGKESVKYFLWKTDAAQEK